MRDALRGRRRVVVIVPVSLASFARQLLETVPLLRGEDFAKPRVRALANGAKLRAALPSYRVHLRMRVLEDGKHRLLDGKLLQPSD